MPSTGKEGKHLLIAASAAIALACALFFYFAKDNESRLSSEQVSRLPLRRELDWEGDTAKQFSESVTKMARDTGVELIAIEPVTLPGMGKISTWCRRIPRISMPGNLPPNSFTKSQVSCRLREFA